jgi:hypothetical protein
VPVSQVLAVKPGGQLQVRDRGRDPVSGRPSLLTRVAHTRELRAWALLALALGTIEGGVLGVVMKTAFAAVATASALDAAVAIVVGAPHYATLQILGMGGLLLVALAPVSASGVVIVASGAVVARVLWGGVVTVRGTVWRLNYRQESRARLTGRLLTVHSLLMGAAGMAAGALITRHPAAFRWIYVAAAATGALGAAVYARTRVRGQRTLLATERARSLAPWPPAVIASTLRADRAYRNYMLCVFLSGFGDLMLVPPLIAVMSDHLRVGPFHQVLFASAIPTLVVPLGIGPWAALMDRAHTIRFQIVHSGSFVVALAVFALAGIGGWPLVLWPAAVLLGISHAGGAIGWNLGHHHFASPATATSYMSVHATLTGVRGVLAPLTGVALYRLLEIWSPGAGVWTLAIPPLLCAVAAAGFATMLRPSG